MSTSTLILDNGFKSIHVAQWGPNVLDMALDAWADEDNAGCVLTIETPDGASWHFNPEQHARFVQGPVQG